MIPLSWVSRKHALAFPSAAREIMCDCSTAWRMAREELTGGSSQPQRNSQMEDLEERLLRRLSNRHRRTDESPSPTVHVSGHASSQTVP
jgi:hypothetical protein